MLANRRIMNLERISITRESGIAARSEVQTEDPAHGIQQMEIDVVIIFVGSIALPLLKMEKSLQRSNKLHLVNCGSVNNQGRKNSTIKQRHLSLRRFLI